MSPSLTLERERTIDSRTVGWFCLRTHPKHEHIAAAHLRKIDGVEVFLPRVRFKRVTQQAVVWVTEALFPGYLFAMFDWDQRLRQVQGARGLQYIVHFGNHWPVLSDAMIDELREIVGTTELHTIIPEFVPGDAVHFTAANLRGLQGIVSKVLPGQKRIEVLLELLGRQTGIEMAADSLIKVGNERTALFH